MSKKSAKRNRHQKSSGEDTVSESMTFVSRDQFLDYLRKIMTRYSGYQFISVSKPLKSTNGKYDVIIKVHRSIPIQDKYGHYHSDMDQFVRFVQVEEQEFEGLIMDRNKNYAFGNPFTHHFDNVVDEKIPNLGKEKVLTKGDDAVQPL